MCGIAGFVTTSQADPRTPEGSRDPQGRRSLLARMGDSLACRGPDASGVWLSDRASYVHRRLIVVDPEGGAQPMHLTQDGEEYVLNYNGELYNTEELRADLVAMGHRFTGHSDTEVLLHALATWGTGALSRLNGIFAFALWNETRRELLLARDRLGVKPLFYSLRPDALVFGSEMKAVLKHPSVRHEIRADGLAEIFAIGPARTPGFGIFRDLSELRPGQYLLYDDARGDRVHTYWRLESHEHPDDLDTTARHVRDLLKDTVERQLVSDVPISTMLSGGLDSSAVSAFAARHLASQGRDPLKTFSVTFRNMDRDFRPGEFQTNLDAPYVLRMRDALGTDHTEVVLDTPELIEFHGRALTARDHPGMADVDTSLFLFAREIRRHVTVALSGEAADEILGGYPWCQREDGIQAKTFPWSLRLADRLSLLSDETLSFAKPAQYVAGRYAEALEEVPRLAGEDPTEARMRELIYLNITRFLPTLLDRKDRMTMAVGLEVRVPFCDHRLVEYVWNIPWAMKNHGGMAKGILRHGLLGDLPEEVRVRRKSPYPSTHNPAYGEAFRARLQMVLDDPTSPVLAFLDRPSLERILRADLDTTDLPWFGQLMGMAQLYAYLVQVNQWLTDYDVSVV